MWTGPAWPRADMRLICVGFCFFSLPFNGVIWGVWRSCESGYYNTPWDTQGSGFIHRRWMLVLGWVGGLVGVFIINLIWQLEGWLT